VEVGSDDRRLRSLLPWRLLSAIDRPDGRPGDYPFVGAALAADISGYTRIAERLCQAGDEGLGRLSALLSAEFSRYLDIVSAFGGEVVSIAGDALLACFLPTDGPALERAEACARALAELPIFGHGEEERVSLHLGVARGPIWLARVGGWFQRWELLVGGAAIRNAFQAASSAESGQVVLSAEGPPTTDTGVDSVFSVFRPFAVAADDWRWGLLPPRLLEDHRTGRPWTSELRRVNVLFVRIHGLDEAGPSAVADYQRVVLALHESIGATSATSGRLLIDNGGLVFVLVLGDPLNARGDDPDRVLTFGMALRRRLNMLGLHASMGFASGRVFCGVIGNDVRRQYVTVGPTMNLAARLMDSSAEGLIAALPLPSYRLSRYKLVSGDPVSLKGLAHPVATVAVSEVSDTERAHEAICGREQEIAALTRLVASSARDEGGVAWIFGEAGLGKTSLVRRLCKQATAAGVRCLVGEGDPAEASSSYFAWRPIVRALLSASPEASVESLHRELVDRLALLGRSADFAPLFNSILPLHLPETPVTSQLRGTTRVEVLVDLLIDLVRQESARPLIIVLEDAHWIDSASLLLADQIVSRLKHLLLVVTTRPGNEEATQAKLLAHPAVVRVELAPLPLDSVGDLATLACSAPVDDSVVALVFEQTAGNPFFAREYVQQLKETGRLLFDRGTWKLSTAGAQTFDASPTLQGVIASRIDALSPDEQRVLKSAAILGQQIDLSVLQEILPDAISVQTDTFVTALERKRFVIRDADAPKGALRFGHALVRSVAYDLMVFTDRLDLHRAAAAAIERRMPGALGGHPVLVHHWYRAQNVAKAAEHAERAAEEGVQLGTFREVESFIDICLEYAQKEPTFAGPLRRARWQLALSEAASGLGDLEKRRTHATQALALSGRHVPKSTASAIIGALTALVLRAARRMVGRGATRKESEPARTLEADLARANRQLSVVAYFANEPFRILYFAAHALAHAERVGPCADLCGALAEIGAWFGLAGASGLARRYFAHALVTADKLTDASASAYVNFVRSLYSIGRGDWRAVRSGVDRCQELCVAMGDRVQWANAQIVRFWLHHYLGEVAEAEKAAHGLMVSARESGNRQHRTWALRSLALCGLTRGAVAEPLGLLEESMSLLDKSADRNEVLPTKGGLALALFRADRREAAIASAAAVLKEMRDLGRPMGHGTLEGWSGITEVLVSAFETDPRSHLLSEQSRMAVRYLKRQAAVFPIATPRYRYWQGRLRLAKGRDPTGVLNRGLGAARTMGMPSETERLRDALRVVEGRG
jgi:class 3 adenylate cyclase